MFTAEKIRTMTVFGAYRAEAEGNAAAETQGAKMIAAASGSIVASAQSVKQEMMSSLLALSGILETDPNLIMSILNPAQTSLRSLQQNSGRPAAVTAANQLISGTKSANATARANTVTAAEKAYVLASAVASAAYSIGALSAWTTYVTAATNAGVSYDTAMKAAGDTYTNSIITATEEYDEDYCRITGLYQDAINIINGGGAILPGHFDGAGSMDVEVCFVAGTPILMADGTTKPIEEIDFLDEVWAKNYDHPEGKLYKCKVSMIYHNAPSETYEVDFGDLKFRATPVHPFYVVGKGWTPVKDLQPGDTCLSAAETFHVLRSKTFIAEKVPVYNFQVSNAHTYFVGESMEQSLLVHNDCSNPNCSGGKIREVVQWTDSSTGLIGGSLMEKDCPICSKDYAQVIQWLKDHPDAKYGDPQFHKQLQEAKLGSGNSIATPGWAPRPDPAFKTKTYKIDSGKLKYLGLYQNMLNGRAVLFPTGTVDKEFRGIADPSPKQSDTGNITYQPRQSGRINPVTSSEAQKTTRLNTSGSAKADATNAALNRVRALQLSDGSEITVQTYEAKNGRAYFVFLYNCEQIHYNRYPTFYHIYEEMPFDFIPGSAILNDVLKLGPWKGEILFE